MIDNPAHQMIGPLVHYAPVGGKDGPHGIAQWHLDAGWPEFRYRVIDPAEHLTRRVMLWMPTGSAKSETTGGFLFRQVAAAYRLGNSQVLDLIDGLPAFIAELRRDGWEVMSYTGSPSFETEPITRIDGAIELAPFVGSNVCLDHSADIDHNWPGFRFIEKVTHGRALVEGRLRVANPGLNTRFIGKVWEGRFTPSNPEVYIPIERLKGWTGEMLVHAPQGRDKTEWQLERDMALPATVFRIIDSRAE